MMNTRKIFVHIGMPKTGTSALQAFLFNNRDILASHGFLYPDLGMHQHMPLVRSLSCEAHSPAGFPGGGLDLPLPGFKELVEREAALKNCHTVIISSEFFFDYPGLTPHRPDFPIEQAIPYLRSVAFRLKEMFAEYSASVVVWLRRQDHWLMSMYNNAVKVANFKHDFEVFFRRQVAPWYGVILDQWADAFSPENVLVNVYEKGDETCDVIPRFLQLVRFPAQEMGLRTSKEHPREANIGLSRQLLLVKREINKHLPENMPGLRHSVEDLFFSLAGEDVKSGRIGPALLSPEARREILARFDGENQRVLARFFPPTRSVLFQEPYPEDADWLDPGPADAETLLRVFVPLLFAQARRIKALEGRLDRRGSHKA